MDCFGSEGDFDKGAEAISNISVTFGVVKSGEIMRMLKRDGWFEKRQSGSHVIMIHPKKRGQLVVPNHG